MPCRIQAAAWLILLLAVTCSVARTPPTTVDADGSLTGNGAYQHDLPETAAATHVQQWPGSWDDEHEGSNSDDDNAAAGWLWQHMARLLQESTAGSPSSDLVDADGVADSDASAGPVINASSTVTNSKVSPALTTWEAHMQEVFKALAESLGWSDPSAAAIRYLRLKVARIIHLLAEVAWLIYAIGYFAQRTFLLMLPFVPAFQTGQLVLNAKSALNLAMVFSDFIARAGDLVTKIFLLVFRALILATTLPP
jgi:hypothetical protein